MGTVVAIDNISRCALRAEIEIWVIWSHDVWMLLWPRRLTDESDYGIGIVGDLEKQENTDNA
jgi:hypothetical protein